MDTILKSVDLDSLKNLTSITGRLKQTKLSSNSMRLPGKILHEVGRTLGTTAPDQQRIVEVKRPKMGIASPARFFFCSGGSMAIGGVNTKPLK